MSEGGAVDPVKESTQAVEAAVDAVPWWKKALGIAGVVLGAVFAVAAAVFGFLMFRRLPEAPADGSQTPEGAAFKETSAELAKEQNARLAAERDRDMLTLSAGKADLEGTVNAATEVKKEAVREQEKQDTARATGGDAYRLLDDIVRDGDSKRK